jgi:hypothetical protein
MEEYKRETPLFSLCGLNCGLCPRHHTEGTSQCPGCGGMDFHLKHPSCPVISCGKKHGGVEYCFLCESYPCERYKSPSKKDSFITYRNVSKDMRKAAQNGIGRYMAELNEKTAFLKTLLSRYNDGRNKSFYCAAVNLLSLEDLNGVKLRMEEMDRAAPKEDRIKKVKAWLEEKAESKNIDLKLRK